MKQLVKVDRKHGENGMCVLYERACTDCGECDMCDLDPEKVCDNCCKCIDIEGLNYKTVEIDAILTDKDEIEMYQNDGFYDDEEE